MATTRCDPDPNKCRSQVELNRFLRDPVLGPFLRSRTISNEDNSSAQKIGGYGWISLPTTSSNGTGESKLRLNTNNTVINFFAIKKYTPEESKTIFNALTNSMSAGKGTGRNIIFDEHGNFACWDGTINKILRNPIIPPGARFKSDSKLEAGNASTGETLKTLFNTHGDYLGEKLIYYYNEKIIVNPKMTYIIMTKDTVPSENSVYYLVYNPIHRKKFQEYYSHLLGYEGVWRGNKLIKAIGNLGYQKEDVDTVPAATGGPKMTAPSFISVAARYCNALKIGGDTLPNGKAGEHYADPTCNFILSDDDANLGLITGRNYTQSNLAYERYAPINSTNAKAKASFLRSKQILFSGADNSQLKWPCKDSRPMGENSSISFAENEGLLFENSSSFVNVLGNAYINNFDVALTNNNNALNVGGENFKRQPTCKTRNITINSCKNVIEIGGNASNNEFSMASVCGGAQKPGQPVVQEDPEDPVTTGGDGKPKPGSKPGSKPGGKASEEDDTMLYVIIAVVLLLAMITTSVILFL
jgi:hypothetical protein